MKLTTKIVTSLTLLLLLNSCKKNGIETKQQENTKLNPSLVYKIPETQAEKELVANLGKVTTVLKEMYKNKANLKVVNAAIIAHVYTDQSILLKDLLYPASSRLVKNNKFETLTTKWKVSLQEFSTRFWQIASQSNDPAFMSFLQSLSTASRLTNGREMTGGDGSDITIYSPYMEEFLPADDPGGGGYYEPITTVVTATADADQGWGSQPYYINGVLDSYVQVMVDDAYAEANPTQIIGINGIEPYNPPTVINAAFPPESPIDIPNLVREVKQVYVGDVRCTKQYDALISFTGNGGGSEIRFTRADGFLKLVDGQVQADMFFNGDESISRYNIRKENWVDFSNEWDGDWEASNLQQNLAIYEDDNRNSSTFSSNLSTTLTFPPAGGQPGFTATGSIGFTISFKSDDALIKQTNYNRDVFFVLNRTNLEGELKNGWPVRDKNNNVSFTLNDRTYY